MWNPVIQSRIMEGWQVQSGQPFRGRIICNLCVLMLYGVSPLLAQQARPLDPIADQLQPDRTLVYKRIGHRELKLHVFEPKEHRSEDCRSVYLIVHGGGWSGGSARRCYPFADYFRNQGMLAISMEYRLLDKPAGTTVFDCVRDGRSAVRYVRQHADELGIDPQKIFIAGCSAGGHVAAGTALFDGVDEASDATHVSCVPNAMVLYYPVIDTSSEGYGQEKIGDLWKQLSPRHRVKARLPPAIIFHGTVDQVTPYAGAISFHEQMLAAGNRCELVSQEGGNHGYLIFDLAVFNAAMERTSDFLLRTVPNAQAPDNEQ